MLQKHYRCRVLTTHYKALVEAAEATLSGGSPDDLRRSVAEARQIIAWHGYKKKEVRGRE